MVDLKGKPFYLGEEECRWVEETLKGMSEKEKVGQLFCEILWDRPGDEPEMLLEGLEPGGVMYRPFPGKRCGSILRGFRRRQKFRC